MGAALWQILKRKEEGKVVKEEKTENKKRVTYKKELERKSVKLRKK